jgi:osomolarity two-component system response regulator SKN7
MPKLGRITATNLIRKFANFERVLVMNNMPTAEQQQQMQRHSATALARLLDSRSNTMDGLPATSTLSSPTTLSQQQPSQISSSFTSLLGMGEDDVRINNPLAGMGLSDKHYSMVLQNLVNGERFTGMWMDGGGVSGSGESGGRSGGIKRTIDDVGFRYDKRAGKRSRFEVID